MLLSRYRSLPLSDALSRLFACAALTIGVTGLLGCDPVGSAAAIVVDAKKAPVAGVKARFTCPSSSSANGGEAVSDAAGRFVYEHIPSIPDTCTISLEKAGYKTRTLTMKDVLHQSGMLTGKEVLPEVQLDPAP